VAAGCPPTRTTPCAHAGAGAVDLYFGPHLGPQRRCWRHGVVAREAAALPTHRGARLRRRGAASRQQAAKASQAGTGQGTLGWHPLWPRPCRQQLPARTRGRPCLSRSRSSQSSSLPAMPPAGAPPCVDAAEEQATAAAAAAAAAAVAAGCGVAGAGRPSDALGRHRCADGTCQQAEPQARWARLAATEASLPHSPLLTRPRLLHALSGCATGPALRAPARLPLTSAPARAGLGRP
jgi:hypothetical protein